MSWIAALDPGRSKCGLVLASLDQRCVIEGHVLPADAVLNTLERWQRSTPPERLIVGNGTSSALWTAQLSNVLPVTLVDERGTTLTARTRYWQLWPPRGWRRLVPLGLQLPPGELDALAALVMLEKTLGFPLDWPEPPSIKTGP